VNLRVSETTAWSDVEGAALAAGTCIRPGGPNHERARASFVDGVRYFLQEARNPQYQWAAVGYIRLHRVSESTGNPLWIVDFASPFNYRAIRLVHQQLAAPLLVHKRAADDEDLVEHWPTLPLRLPRAGNTSSTNAREVMRATGCW
jgi:hypothetical protein